MPKDKESEEPNRHDGDYLEPEDIDCISHNFNLGPYFFLGKCHKVEDIKELIELNKERQYGEYPEPGEDASSMLYREFPYSTSGLFRGQIKDWPLKPKSFRSIANTDEPGSDAVKSLRFSQNNSDLKDFIEIAPKHNPEFPDDLSDQISIARHFGVNTPLLDWTHNVLVALYFAVNKILTVDKFARYPVSFIYHIPDETDIKEGIPEDLESLSRYPYTSYVNPYNIDRRIDRQRSAFTYHPHPTLDPNKIEVDVYIMGYHFMDEMRDLLSGLGFTYDYFFPDYAGLAEFVSAEASLL